MTTCSLKPKLLPSGEKTTLRAIVDSALRREVRPATVMENPDPEKFEVCPLGLLVLKRRPGAKPMTSEDVRRLQEECDEEDFQRAMKLRGGMIYLLDANVLIALLDSEHAHHARALRFFPTAQREGWATCPLVENDFLRIFGRSDYPNGPGSPESARRLLVQYCSTAGHRFLPDDATLRDSYEFSSLPKSADLTNIYLIGLAVKHGGRFATFDAGIDASLIPGGPKAYYLIPAVTA